MVEVFFVYILEAIDTSNKLFDSSAPEFTTLSEQYSSDL
jgi:hypothetical protein